MARTKNYSKSYSTVSQPGVSAASGFLKSVNEGMESNRKEESLLAPKIMEIRARYQLEGMKQKQKQADESDKQMQNEKRELQKQLIDIKKFYKQKKFLLREKMATVKDDSDPLTDLMMKQKDPNYVKPESEKLKKLKELYSQVEESEMEDTKDILDQLRSYYKK